MENNFSPLFGAGTARGGTGLAVQTLRAHKRIELAMEPFLLYFKHYRVAVHKKLNYQSKEDVDVPELNEPIRSLYYNSKDIPYINNILNFPGDIALEKGQLKEIQEGIRSRAHYDAADLIPYIEQMEGDTFGEFMKSSLTIIKNARKRDDLSWCGMLENWSIEFFPFLAESFPDAKFFVVVRDPRAVLCSALHAPPELRATLLSYLRSVRKMLDLCIHYSQDKRFKNKLCILKFESLVNNPSLLSSQVSTFLGLEYDPNMINPDYHVVPGSNEPRDGVSSFEQKATGYSPARTSRWKTILEPEIISIINSLYELVLGLEWGRQVCNLQSITFWGLNNLLIDS